MSTRSASNPPLSKGQKLPPLSERLAKIGLESDWDFVLHLPLRYEDETHVTPVASLVLGQAAQVRLTIVHQQTLHTTRFEQLIVRGEDETGELTLRFFHFFPSIQKQLQEGNTVLLYGEPREGYNGGIEMVHPRVKAGDIPDQSLPKALTPIYPAGEGIQQRWLRKRIDRAMLDLNLADPVPVAFTSALGLPDFKSSLTYIHHPPQGADVESLQLRTAPSWQRLIFDELLAQQVTLRRSRDEASQYKAPQLLAASHSLEERFLANLGFSLTRAQERVFGEIARDLESPRPMHRLVQGDVGCGKTVVAALSAIRAIEAGYQATLMAPTEILAEQHYKKLSQWLEPIGIKTVWLAGKMKASEKAEALAALADGSAQLAVGTHALIQEGVRFLSLGLAIVDEQHRFGVAQRLSLRTASSEGSMAHLLMLSATPIPRTLAMSYLADLDVSIIDELPPGRTPVQTKLVRLERKAEIYQLLQQAVQEGRQAYWVCPLVEESDVLDLTPATMARDELAHALPQCRIGLVHGQMPAEDKESIMTAFAQGELDILVSTTVIEVGVDVPNATLMVIEHAERFGLSQLHQLRGRVGRGAAKSSCLLLFGAQLSDTGKERLKIIRESTDGFEIARRDLQLRGPGEFLGERQSGMPMLRFADLDRDSALLQAATTMAQTWLEQDRESALAHAQRWFHHRNDLLTA